MAGAVSTVAGNGQQGYADGEGAVVRFNCPAAVVVDKEGTVRENDRLRRLTGRHVTTLAGGSEADTADGAGPGARFTRPTCLALDERGRLSPARLRIRPGGHAAGGGGFAGASAVDGAHQRGGPCASFRAEGPCDCEATGGLRQDGGDA